MCPLGTLTYCALVYRQRNFCDSLKHATLRQVRRIVSLGHFTYTPMGSFWESLFIMDSQVSEICRSAFYNIRALRHIRPVITDEV